jgi:Protein of unknown function (DUF2971)
MILYKYSGPSGIKILEGMRLKVTPPNELNDPFEVTPCSRNSMTRSFIIRKAKTDPGHFRETYDLLVANEGFKGTLSDVVEALKTLPRKKYSEFLKLYKQGLIDRDLRSREDASRSVVVLCLSAVNDSVPMWSHYGDHHKGVVVGFDAGDCCFSTGTGIRKVMYTARRVKVDSLVEATEQEQIAEIEKIVLTKSPDWKYEQEYRACWAKADVIEQPAANGSLYFIEIRPKVVKEVVLGCCIQDAYERQIRDLLRFPFFAHVRLFRAKQHKSRFALDILPV